MTKLTVTYHMHAGPYEDESAIAVPMSDDKAREILNLQGGSRYVHPTNDGRRGLLLALLDKLAKLQGYQFASFVCAEESKRG